MITSAVLRLPFARQDHEIDFVGAALLVAGVSTLLLGLVWGGSEYPWGSPVIVGLLAASVALTAVSGTTGLGLMRGHFWARAAAITLLLALIALLALPFGPQPGPLWVLVPAAMLLRLMSAPVHRHLAMRALARAGHTAQRLGERLPSR